VKSLVDIIAPSEISALYAKICSITTKYTFTHPVENADVETVRDELVTLLPGCQIGVNPTERRDFVGVVVAVEGRCVYQRMLRVEGRPL